MCERVVNMKTSKFEDIICSACPLAEGKTKEENQEAMKLHIPCGLWNGTLWKLLWPWDCGMLSHLTEKQLLAEIEKAGGEQAIEAYKKKKEELKKRLINNSASGAEDSEGKTADEEDKKLIREYIEATKDKRLEWERWTETDLWYTAQEGWVVIGFGLGRYTLIIGSREIHEEGPHMAGASKEPLVAVLWEEVLKSLGIDPS